MSLDGSMIPLFFFLILSLRLTFAETVVVERFRGYHIPGRKYDTALFSFNSQPSVAVSAIRVWGRSFPRLRLLNLDILFPLP